MKYSDLGNYKDFLNAFQNKGYEFISFNEFNKEKGQFILRHDIDFDTSLALKTAQQEYQMGIKATYFFLLRSVFYNVLHSQDYDNIMAIKTMGHTISIHFDPVIYDDFNTGLKFEVGIFKEIFGESVKIISLHRPNDFFLKHDNTIFDLEHTYQSKYFKKIKYFADSTGKWRFGNPTYSEEYISKSSLHVLIHPIWWYTEGSNNLDKLRNYFAFRKQHLKEHFSLNCIPFREIHETL